MRRTLAAAAVFSCLCAFVGCRHVAGVCDCTPDPTPNYWGCPGWTPGFAGAAGCAGCGAPAVTVATPAPAPAPAPEPESLKVMPKAEEPGKEAAPSR